MGPRYLTVWTRDEFFCGRFDGDTGPRGEAGRTYTDSELSDGLFFSHQIEAGHLIYPRPDRNDYTYHSSVYQPVNLTEACEAV